MEKGYLQGNPLTRGRCLFLLALVCLVCLSDCLSVCLSIAALHMNDLSSPIAMSVRVSCSSTRFGDDPASTNPVSDWNG